MRLGLIDVTDPPVRCQEGRRHERNAREPAKPFSEARPRPVLGTCAQTRLSRTPLDGPTHVNQAVR
jgi:hypothetical protein